MVAGDRGVVLQVERLAQPFVHLRDRLLDRQGLQRRHRRAGRRDRDPAQDGQGVGQDRQQPRLVIRWLEPFDQPVKGLDDLALDPDVGDRPPGAESADPLVMRQILAEQMHPMDRPGGLGIGTIKMMAARRTVDHIARQYFPAPAVLLVISFALGAVDQDAFGMPMPFPVMVPGLVVDAALENLQPRQRRTRQCRPLFPFRRRHVSDPGVPEGRYDVLKMAGADFGRHLLLGFAHAWISPADDGSVPASYCICHHPGKQARLSLTEARRHRGEGNFMSDVFATL